MLGMQLSADDADTDQSLDTPSVRALLSPSPRQVCSLQARHLHQGCKCCTMNNYQARNMFIKWIFYVLNKKILQYLVSYRVPDTLVVFSITIRFDQIDSIDVFQFSQVVTLECTTCEHSFFPLS